MQYFFAMELFVTSVEVLEVMENISKWFIDHDIFLFPHLGTTSHFWTLLLWEVAIYLPLHQIFQEYLDKFPIPFFVFSAFPFLSHLPKLFLLWKNPAPHLFGLYLYFLSRNIKTNQFWKQLNKLPFLFLTYTWECKKQLERFYRLFLWNFCKIKTKLFLKRPMRRTSLLLSERIFFFNERYDISV